MKKIISLTFIAALTAAMIGCDPAPKDEPTTTTPPATATEKDKAKTDAE